MEKRIQGNIRKIVGAKSARARILARIDDLPSSPAIAAEIERVASDPKSSVGAIETTIKRDQALAAKLLRLVNSAYFGLSQRQSSLAQAIVLAGTKTIRNMVFAVTTNSLLVRRLSAYGYDKLGLWTHSIAVAIAASTLGQRLGAKDGSAEELFVAGLLHDVGKLILGEFISDMTPEQKTALFSGGAGQLKVEHELTGFDHAELGAIIAQKWNLSDMHAEIIRCHHKPTMTKEYPHGALLVHLADILSKKLGLGFKDEHPYDVSADMAALERLRFDEKSVDALAAMVSESFEEQKGLYLALEP